MISIKNLNPDKIMSIGIALTFAVDVLHIWEERYPEYMRPRKAVIEAMKYIRYSNASATSSYKNYAVASSASSATYDVYATHTAYLPSDSSDYSAYSAASSVSSAAYAVYLFSSHSTYAAISSVNHAASAVYASNLTLKNKYIHNKIVKILPLILEYKIRCSQSFNNSGVILEYLNEEDRDKFLFNLDILR